MSAEEIVDLWDRFHQTGSDCFQTALMEHYLWIARNEARRVAARVPRGAAELHELVNEGVIGLADALRNFNPSIGAGFHSYAKCRVRGHIVSYLRANDHLSKHRRHQIRELCSAVDALRCKLGYEPTAEEICENTGIEPAVYHRIRQDQMGARPLSLDDLMNTDERDPDSRKRPEPVDPQATVPDGSPTRPALLALVAAEMAGLKPALSVVLSLRYVEELTRAEAAAVLGLESWRVRTLEERALAALRERIRTMLPGRL